MENINIRYLNEYDFNCGFFETLSNLTEIGQISENREHFISILDGINRYPNIYHVLVATIKSGNTINNDTISEIVVGTASILIEQKFIHNGGYVGHIEDVSVHKKYEGKGIGSKLIKKCVDIAKECKCYKVILDCDISKEKFYEKSGFKQSCISMRLNID